MVLTDGAVDPIALKIIKRHEQLRTERANWESLWDDIAKFVIPRKENTYDAGTPGTNKNRHLYDGTSIHSNELLSSALHGMLTNPATEFFGLTSGHSLLDQEDEVRRWFQQCVNITHNVLNNTNFHTELHELYTDLGGFGTSVLLVEEDPKYILNFKTHPIYEVFIDEDSRGLVDTVYRSFKYSIRQIRQEFGDKVITKEMHEIELEKPDQKFEIIHAVFPRTDEFTNTSFPKKNPKRFPVASFYVIKKYKTVLSESGFDMFPFAVPRWTKISGEKYGRSPAMKAMPDIKMLNEMSKTIIRSAQLAIAPPIQVTDTGMFRRVKMTPGAMNVVRPGAEIKPIFTGADVRLGEQLVQDTRDRIRQAFFIDQLQLNEGPQMTATEVMQRTEEKLRLMGPILGRQQFELLRPVVENVFSKLMKQGFYPEMPESLQGLEINVQYSSTIARAQHAADIDNFSRWFGTTAPLFEINPAVIDNLDTDAVFRGTALALNVNQDFLKDQVEVEQKRAQDAQQQQQMQQQMQQQQEAETMKTMSETEVNEAQVQQQ